MMGGGTQGFLSRFPDGTMRFLPFDYSKTSGTWFCNTNTRKNQGWVPITEDLSLADCGDWPPNRIIGTNDRFANCQECHGSQINVTFDFRERKYKTRFTTLAINCESCHGPGKRHVELAQSGKIGETADIGIRSLSTLNKDASIEVCFQCHSVKDVIRPDYLPGKNLQDHFAMKFSALGDRPHHPDGRVRTFAYQEGHLFSDCYVNGSMTCVDCHDPHSQGYRDVSRNPLPDRFDNHQCTGCHASKAEASDRHSHHQLNSRGNLCVSCHMLYLQHPEVGNKIRFARSDHTISIPRPLFDASLGIESACKQCHQDKTVEWLENRTRSWYGEGKPHKPIIQGLLKAQKTKNFSAAAKLVLLPSVNFPAAQFAGLSYLLDNFPIAAMQLEKGVLDSLKKLAESDDDDVAGLALASLHITQSSSVGVKSLLQNFLGLSTDRDERIRQRWTLTLGYLGDKYREAGLFREAIGVYKKANEIDSKNSKIMLNLAQAYAGNRENANALTAYRRSIQLDSLQPLTYVNLGILLFEQKEISEAIEMYKKAIEINPYEPLAFFNLGNAYLQQGREFSAIEAYEKALEFDPGLALGHFYLARAYVLTKDYAKALHAVNEGLEFEPSNTSARQMRKDLERLLQ